MIAILCLCPPSRLDKFVNFLFPETSYLERKVTNQIMTITPATSKHAVRTFGGSERATARLFEECRFILKDLVVVSSN
jgi:hypothetical protein